MNPRVSPRYPEHSLHYLQIVFPVDDSTFVVEHGITFRLLFPVDGFEFFGTGNCGEKGGFGHVLMEFLSDGIKLFFLLE